MLRGFVMLWKYWQDVDVMKRRNVRWNSLSSRKRSIPQKRGGKTISEQRTLCCFWETVVRAWGLSFTKKLFVSRLEWKKKKNPPKRKTEQILLHIFRCRLVHYCEIFCDIIQHPADIPGSHAPNFMDILCFPVTSIRTHLVNVNSNPKSFTPHIIFACSKNTS